MNCTTNKKPQIWPLAMLGFYKPKKLGFLNRFSIPELCITEANYDKPSSNETTVMLNLPKPSMLLMLQD